MGGINEAQLVKEQLSDRTLRIRAIFLGAIFVAVGALALFVFVAR